MAFEREERQWAVIEETAVFVTVADGKLAVTVT